MNVKRMPGSCWNTYLYFACFGFASITCTIWVNVIVIGLALSYVVVFRMRDWLLDVPADSTIPVSTLISFPVLLAVFAVCLIINLLSAGIPAYRASRMKIINSLNQNDK